MNKKTILLITIGALGAALACFSQEASNGNYEELPELQASEIIKPEIMKGVLHTVREPVTPFSGSNKFTIDSQYGVFEAEGNEMLYRRVKEIYAISQLKDVSRTEQFTKALGNAAKSPLVVAKNVVTDPVNTVVSVPKGLFKFMGRTGEKLKGVGQKKEGKDPEGKRVEQLLGYSKTKRQIAVDMGVDPYSTNAVLQKELGGIAWATWAGGFTFTAATFPISGPAGLALTVTGVSSRLDELVKDKDPTDLKIINRKALIEMGTPEKDVVRFLNNNSFSPSEATAFVLNLQALDGVSNRAGFVRSAAEGCTDVSDAIFCVRTAALMAQVHSGEKPIAGIVMLGDFPVCMAKDGSVVLVLQWDYAAWTSGAATVAGQLQALAGKSGKPRPILAAISGQASPRLKQELQSRGIALHDRVNPGPLK